MFDWKDYKASRTLLFLAILGSAQAMIGCGSSATESKGSGYVTQHDDRWRNRSINVCFTQTISGLDTAKDIVIRGINEEYSKIGFRFNLQGNCFGSQVIGISFVQGATSQVNVIGSGVTQVLLGVDHQCLSSSGQPLYYLESNCLRNVAVHEFGHVLGLHHEMNRRDNDNRCQLDQTSGMGESRAIQIGDYDNTSVMNYCQVLRMNDRNQRMPLSPGDLNTLRAIYEGPVATVDSMPSSRMSDLSGIRFRVGGTGVTEYQLKFGFASRVNCRDASGYSNFLPVSYQNTGAEMVAAFLGGNSREAGDYRICLIGRNAQKTQAYINYSSIDVTIP